MAKCVGLPHRFDDNHCTTNLTSKDFGTVIGPLCESDWDYSGHLNFKPAVFEGRIYWGEHSNPEPFGDDDYTLTLVTRGNAGLTSANATGLGIEFDTDETIDYFTTPWWDGFHQAVDHLNGGPERAINGKKAIVLGLLGLDGVHDLHSELHPVWALAIHVKDSAQDDVWSIFVMNWGNEGYCSKNNHTIALHGNTFTFLLPWRSGAEGVQKKNNTVFRNNDVGHEMSYSVRPMPESSPRTVNVQFHLPPPQLGGRIHGELHLAWHGGHLQEAGETEDVRETVETDNDESRDLIDLFDRLSIAEQSDLVRKMSAVHDEAPLNSRRLDEIETQETEFKDEAEAPITDAGVAFTDGDPAAAAERARIDRLLMDAFHTSDSEPSRE